MNFPELHRRCLIGLLDLPVSEVTNSSSQVVIQQVAAHRNISVRIQNVQIAQFNSHATNQDNKKSRRNQDPVLDSDLVGLLLNSPTMYAGWRFIESSEFCGRGTRQEDMYPWHTTRSYILSHRNAMGYCFLRAVGNLLRMHNL